MRFKHIVIGISAIAIAITGILAWKRVKAIALDDSWDEDEYSEA
jgi:hypothetical protein